MLRLLRERGFPAREIVPFASERSAGRELEGGLIVQPLTDETIQGFDVAIFSRRRRDLRRVGAALRRGGRDRRRQLARSGGWTTTCRSSSPRSTPRRSTATDGIVANPNCSTMQMVVALKPLHDAAGIERLVISTYQAVSGTGKKGVDELLGQSHALLHGDESPAPSVYAHQIAFNALPHAGTFAPGDDHTDEERKLINETRKILGDPSIRVSATCVRVPVVNGHSEAVNVETREPLSPERGARAAARRAGRDGARRPGRRHLPAGDRGRRQGRRVRRAHPPRPRPRRSARLCGSSRTTCARARRRTRSRSPSCCTRAGWSARAWRSRTSAGGGPPPPAAQAVPRPGAIRRCGHGAAASPRQGAATTLLP